MVKPTGFWLGWTSLLLSATAGPADRKLLAREDAHLATPNSWRARGWLTRADDHRGSTNEPMAPTQLLGRSWSTSDVQLHHQLQQGQGHCPCNHGQCSAVSKVCWGYTLVPVPYAIDICFLQLPQLKWSLTDTTVFKQWSTKQLLVFGTPQCHLRNCPGTSTHQVMPPSRKIDFNTHLKQLLHEVGWSKLPISTKVAPALSTFTWHEPQGRGPVAFPTWWAYCQARSSTSYPKGSISEKQNIPARSTGNWSSSAAWRVLRGSGDDNKWKEGHLLCCRVTIIRDEQWLMMVKVNVGWWRIHDARDEPV